MTFEIPGWGTLELHHVVLDLNGTLARDGLLLQGVEDRLRVLADRVEVHVVTADTHGNAAQLVADLATLVVLPPEEAPRAAKARYVEGLEGDVAALGNGRNDAAMLRSARLGVAVIGPEGASPETVAAADVVVNDVLDGLDLLRLRDRLKATLRA